MPLHYRTILSHALAGNTWGDSAERDIVVYVPPHLDRHSKPPVLVVLLHGYGSRALSWALPDHYRDGAVRPGLVGLLDKVFADETMPPAVVAMPDGWTRLGGGQWMDSPVNGALTSYAAYEIVELVEREFGTDPDARSRIVIGHSSGGLGAWELATTTGQFGSLGFLAGDALFERTQLPFVANLLAEHPNVAALLSEALPSSLALPMALASSYSPNPSSQLLPFSLPLDAQTGALDEGVWHLWKSKDPVINAPERIHALRSLRSILLDVGDRDEYTAQLAQRALAARLNALGISHDAVEFPGRHSTHTNERVAAAVGRLARSGRRDSERG
jgi:enterochelin esterase-like enzyme